MHIPLTDAELDILEQRLDAYPDALTLDALQGFCAAQASSPQPLPAEQWPGIVLGGVEADADVLELLQHFYADTAQLLAAGGEFAFLVYGQEDNPEQPDYQGWCAGYIHGFTQTPAEVFEDSGNGEAMDELLQPILLLSGILKESIEGATDWMTPDEETEALVEAEDGLGESVRGLYALFRRH